MEGIARFKNHGKGVMPLLDPCRYIREADEAMVTGDRDRVVALIRQAYLAFDLCSSWCEHARAWGKDLTERSS